MTERLASQAILRRDRLCLDAAEVFLDSLEDHPSPVGFRRLEERLDEALERLEAWKPEGPFERMLARHLRSCWRVLRAVSRYRFRWPHVPVAHVVEALAGAGAVERIESYLQEVDRETVWSDLEARHRYRAERVSPADSRFPEAVGAAAARMARGFGDWLEERGWDLPGTDAEIVIGERDGVHSWYRPRDHRVVLGGAEFMVFEEAGGLSVNPVTAIYSLAHEVTGHAVQNALCRELPPPLRPDDRGRLRPATLPASEGFAIHAASIALRFAEERGTAVGLGEDDVEFLRRMVDLTPLHHAVPALVSILVARSAQEPEFDPLAYAEDMLGLEGFGERIDATPVQSANTLLYECACFFGALEVRRVAGELERANVETVDGLRRLGHGAWTLDCYADAVLRR